MIRTAITEKFHGFIGRTADGDRVFVDIELTRRNGYLELTVCAEGYAPGRALTGDIVFGGQADHEVRHILDGYGGELASHLAELPEEVESLLALWDRWHLNGWHSRALPAQVAERARALGHLIESYDPDEAEDEVETIPYHQAEDQYEEWISSGWGEVEVAGMTFDAGRIVRELDPIAFRCGLNDWAAQEGIEIS